MTYGGHIKPRRGIGHLISYFQQFALTICHEHERFSDF